MGYNDASDVMGAAGVHIHGGAGRPWWMVHIGQACLGVLSKMNFEPGGGDPLSWSHLDCTDGYGDFEGHLLVKQNSEQFKGR